MASPSCILQIETERRMASLSGSLPKELLMKVFILLPVKTLCRFRAVCKSWEGLLSSQSFLPSSLSSPRPFTLFLKDCDYGIKKMFFRSNFDPSNALSCNETQFQCEDDIKGFACSNGMVCCLIGLGSSVKLSIGNPLAQQNFCPIPKLETSIMSFGFSFDPNSRNFKILVHSYPYDIWIFDSSVGSWSLLNAQRGISLLPLSSFVCIGTTWYALSNDQQLLVSIDTKRKKWEKIWTPIGFGIMGANGFSCDKIQEWNGRLSYAMVTNEVLEAGIWVLYEDNQWVEVMTLDLKELGLRDFRLHPVVWFDEMFVMENEDNCVTYNSVNDQLKSFPPQWFKGHLVYRPTMFAWKQMEASRWSSLL
ncbi:hypothetical protein AMTRI_Chr02g215860 [Amborella trichopoda]|uniref:F-box domain-containing protein n=1 Tax=Amborella trichopoda TaxID=13333 RepID=U5D7I3_AMBTC|nr:putative F-box protein At5g52610 [Amborella trichopoda]XP_011627605.1 putative F-box protein At5g52610 [Amborella trichopoda]ERN17377.1 hypothetical protein AMTR_s00037p00183170 [Amborella trichopoda]|eukprot:XP_006855910.1 putative F-box protein At5g52610 [Amborella trichopoda]